MVDNILLVYISPLLEHFKSNALYYGFAVSALIAIVLLFVIILLFYILYGTVPGKPRVPSTNLS